MNELKNILEEMGFTYRKTHARTLTCEILDPDEDNKVVFSGSEHEVWKWIQRELETWEAPEKMFISHRGFLKRLDGKPSVGTLLPEKLGKP